MSASSVRGYCLDVLAGRELRWVDKDRATTTRVARDSACDGHTRAVAVDAVLPWWGRTATRSPGAAQLRGSCAQRLDVVEDAHAPGRLVGRVAVVEVGEICRT